MQAITCPQCGNQVSPNHIRCPRCNALLLKPCTGRCSQCQQKNTCG